MIERVQVVTVFLVHDGRIFLIKRSEKVGTYRGHWAAVSGYLEDLPLLHARTEVREEAGLGQEDIRLRGIGVPTPVDDDAEGRHWLVFPFLFETDHPERVVTDWEASESRWIDPLEMADLGCVPGLSEAFDAVWPPFGSDGFWNRLETAATDTEHGSVTLALDALEAFRFLGDEDDFARACRAYAACRPSMGAFPNLADQMMEARWHGLDAASAAAEIQQKAREAAAASSRHAAEWLAGARRVFTHSRSSSVQEAILEWAKGIDKPEVVVTESRPKNEGVGLAAFLSDCGIRVTLITDAEMSVFIPKCDAVIVGCDAITPGGELVNKAGTRFAVLAATASGVRCCAVAQQFKFIPKNWPELDEEQAPWEIECPGDCRVRNVVFDRTPVAAFDAVICEDGPLPG